MVLKQATARVPHPPAELPPLQLAVGDRVEVGERSTEWPEFVFVVADDGSGWVPSRYLASRAAEVTVQVPYDTTELPVDKNQVVEVVTQDDISGWWWCRDQDGTEGWVPISVLTP